MIALGGPFVPARQGAQSSAMPINFITPGSTIPVVGTT